MKKIIASLVAGLALTVLLVSAPINPSNESLSKVTPQHHDPGVGY